MAQVAHTRIALGSADHGEMLLALEALGGGPPGIFMIRSASAKVRKQTAMGLARVMGCRVFQIGLGALSGGAVEETERSLAALFERATASSALLFFDEADALFGPAGTRDATLSSVVRLLIAEREACVIAGTRTVKTAGPFWKAHMVTSLIDG